MMKSYLEKIDTKTIGNRYDVTPLFTDHDCFSNLVDDLAAPFVNKSVDFVACIDALGFILGTAIACHLDVGIIPIRKGGKLPVLTESDEFIDYTGKSKRLEIRKGIVPLNTRILLVDEWIETSAQIQAAIKLLEAQGGIIIGIASIAVDKNEKTKRIRSNYVVHSVWAEPN